MLDKLNSDEVSVVLFLFKVSVKLPTVCKTFYSVSYKHVSVKEGRVKKKSKKVTMNQKRSPINHQRARYSLQK